MILDLFSGANGWGVGLAALGQRDTLGVELNPIAAQTAQANGHATIVASVAELDPRAFLVRASAVVTSSPCQGFSGANARGDGRRDVPLVMTALDVIGYGGGHADETIERLRAQVADERTALVLEPLRWVLDLMPEWTAWEQVPAVLPLWKRCAEILRAHGYSAWAGVLNAEQYGVPQTRKRAVLIASRVRIVGAPTPTHSRYYPHDPARLDDGVLPWVTMADVLDLDRACQVMRSNYGTGGDPANRGRRVLAEPAATVTSKIGRNFWTGGGRHIRPVSLEEAAALQTFPPDYIWHGNSGQRYLQVGNAIPPLLAGAVCGEAMGVEIQHHEERAA